MIPLTSLPAINASLNATCAVLLLTAYGFIRRRHIKAHRNTMLAASVVATLFLTSYVIYHVQVGVTTFPGTGPVRTLYFAILIPHTLLAVANVPLVVITLYRGLSRRYAQHRKIARWTLPVWLYVSVTGVLIYVLLYRLNFA